MKNEVDFYPMSLFPLRDDSDASFSKTVIVFGEKPNIADMGYYDFEDCQWSQFGNDKFLMVCWCYLPFPDFFIRENTLQSIAPNGYKNSIFNGTVR